MEDCSTDERLRQETLCHRQWTDEYVEHPETLTRQNVVVVWIQCLSSSALNVPSPVASPGVRGWAGKVQEVWGTEVPQRGPGAEHDINFALTITLVNAYCPFYSIVSYQRRNWIFKK